MPDRSIASGRSALRIYDVPFSDLSPRPRSGGPELKKGTRVAVHLRLNDDRPPGQPPEPLTELLLHESPLMDAPRPAEALVLRGVLRFPHSSCAG